MYKLLLTVYSFLIFKTNFKFNEWTKQDNKKIKKKKKKKKNKKKKKKKIKKKTPILYKRFCLV